MGLVPFFPFPHHNIRGRLQDGRGPCRCCARAPPTPTCLLAAATLCSCAVVSSPLPFACSYLISTPLPSPPLPRAFFSPPFPHPPAAVFLFLALPGHGKGEKRIKLASGRSTQVSSCCPAISLFCSCVPAAYASSSSSILLPCVLSVLLIG